MLWKNAAECKDLYFLKTISDIPEQWNKVHYYNIQQYKTLIHSIDQDLYQRDVKYTCESFEHYVDSQFLKGWNDVFFFFARSLTEISHQR